MFKLNLHYAKEEIVTLWISIHHSGPVIGEADGEIAQGISDAQGGGIWLAR